MAHVPTAVAVIEPGNTRPMESMGGKAEFGRSKIREERNREGKTFTEVMDKAGKGLPSSETAAGKKTSKSRPEKNRPGLSDFKHSSGPGKSVGKIGLLKSSKIENDAVTAMLDGNTETAKQLKHSIPNHSSQLVVAAAGNGELRTGNAADAAETRNAGNVGKAGKTRSVDSKKNGSSLTGSAPRVEILDNRTKIKALDNPGSAANAGNSGEQESSDKTRSRDFTDRRSIRLESRGTRTGEPTLVKSDAGFAVAETDIELTAKSEVKITERSAAAELARKLDSQAGNDIVRQVKIVLNRANAGEVRINLRPDNLGRVSVRINLDDNRLTGRIFVETAAAREAFRNSLDGLQTKLVESGFGAADLELAWDDSGNEFTGNDQQSGRQKSNREEAVREFENIVPTTVFGETADSHVNMVV